MSHSYPHSQSLPHPSIEARRARGERQAAQRLATWPADGEPGALVVLVLRLFPLGQGIYPRRRYGLRELPLHRINQGLAHYGLQLDGHSVRDCRLFVRITDWPGWFGGIDPDKRAGLFILRREGEEGADASNQLRD